MVSLEELTVVLGQALSQQQADVKIAEAKLSSYEVQAGYHHALMTIFCSPLKEISNEIRWMAVVCLKNGTNKYWRRNAPGGIGEEEKSAIRNMLLQAITMELNQQLALQVSLVIAKIARYDVPTDWQPLVPFLMSNLDSPAGYQASLALYHVVKTLTTKRMLHDRHMFYDLSIQIYDPIIGCWKATTQAFVMDNSNILMIQRSLLSLKSIKLLLVHGSKNGLEQRLADCFADLFDWLLTMLKYRAHYCQAEPLATVLTKWCLQCSKILLEVQKTHSMAYVPYVKNSFELALQFAFNKDWRNVMFERCLVNAFNLLKACIDEPFYRGKKSEEDPAIVAKYAPGSVSSNDLVVQFFKVEVVAEFIQRLIFDFFPISTDELERWATDPENYATQQGGDLWKYSIRPCIESLFLTVFSVFRPIVMPIVKNLVTQLQPLMVEPTYEEAQRRQAIYTAVGLASYNLYDEVDFDKWFLQQLIPELKVNHKNYLIVHRTILWMLAQWSDVKLSEELRPALYETLAVFMGREHDIVIRLSACLSSKTVVDHFDFSAEAFVPFLGRYMFASFHLLVDLTECEGKLVVLQTMAYILERMGDACQPFIPELVTFLPPLWDQAEEHNLLRAAVVGVLVRAVDAMGPDSVHMYPFTLKIIEHSVNVEEPQHVTLMEDALDLWRAVLEQSPEENDDLLALAKFIPPILELGSEHLEPITNVTKMYIVLFKMRFLTLFPDKLTETLGNAYQELSVQGCTFILKIVDMAIRVAPAEAGQIFYRLLGFVLDEITADAYIRELTNTSFSIWCRLLLFAEPIAMRVLADRAALTASANNNAHAHGDQAITRQQPQAPIDIDGEMKVVLDWWLKKMSSVTVVQIQKLMAITLLRLLVDHWSPVMYNKVCAIALAVSELLNDIVEPATRGEGDDQTSSGSPGTSGSALVDLLLIPEDATENAWTELEFDTASRHSARMFEIIKRDVAHTIVLSDFLLHQMRSLAAKIGEKQFAEVLQEIDCETRNTLEDLTKAGMFCTLTR
ncbi:importin-11-like [Varroa jacobsoni]|uniref:Importin N-terminal domain-containing protein n=1 Tax=Varroa destructor TaxID=109461 RepID=A0A7M7M654_VARDE|nr:importin-11-like [Varroa destructor]XP_022696916.1 importin-11-like [Varroa jacobsoni]